MKIGLTLYVLIGKKKYTGEYDIVIGPVADDQVYKVIVQFENGYIDKNEALKRLKT